MLSPVPQLALPSLPWPKWIVALLRRLLAISAQVVLVGGSVALLGCLAAHGQPPVDQADQVDLEQAKKVILDQTNRFRKQQDLEPLSRQDQLQQAAQEFAEYMSKTDKYGHRADGRTPAERAEAAGYDYCIVRENIAYVTDTGNNKAEPLARQFFEGWKESPEHRENLLADAATEIGVGLATGRGRTFFAVQLLGRPESAAFRIEVANQTEQTVTLQTNTGDAKDSFELPPRVRMRMQRCRPVTLSLANSEASVEVGESQSLQIVAADDGNLKIEPAEQAESN